MNNVVSQRPHEIIFQLHNPRSCESPRFAVRLVGDVLVYDNLEEESKSLWRGPFSVPMEESYRLDSWWHGCQQYECKDGCKEAKDSNDFTVANTPTIIREPHRLSLFPVSVWISTNGTNVKQLLSYIWTSTKEEAQDPIQLKETTVAVIRGIAQEPELLQTSETTKFLELRPHLFKRRRPFKFQWLDPSRLTVDAFSKANLQKVRRHTRLGGWIVQTSFWIWVQEANYYRMLVGHLLKLIDDETFPIRLLTTNEAPMRARNCFDSKKKSTTDHLVARKSQQWLTCEQSVLKKYPSVLFVFNVFIRRVVILSKRIRFSRFRNYLREQSVVTEKSSLAFRQSHCRNGFMLV